MLGMVRTVPIFLWCQICVFLGEFSSLFFRAPEDNFSRWYSCCIDGERQIADGNRPSPRAL